MALGLGVLGMEPRVFWSLTPKELAVALKARLGVSEGGDPLSRQAMFRLMQSYPD